MRTHSTISQSRGNRTWRCQTKESDDCPHTNETAGPTLVGGPIGPHDAMPAPNAFLSRHELQIRIHEIEVEACRLRAQLRARVSRV